MPSPKFPDSSLHASDLLGPKYHKRLRSERKGTRKRPSLYLALQYDQSPGEKRYALITSGTLLGQIILTRREIHLQTDDPKWYTEVTGQQTPAPGGQVTLQFPYLPPEHTPKPAQLWRHSHNTRMLVMGVSGPNHHIDLLLPDRPRHSVTFTTVTGEYVTFRSGTSGTSVQVDNAPEITLANTELLRLWQGWSTEEHVVNIACGDWIAEAQAGALGFYHAEHRPLTPDLPLTPRRRLQMLELLSTPAPE